MFRTGFILPGNRIMSKIALFLRGFFVGIRKLERWKVFSDEGFGECRARDIGVLLD